MRSLGRANTPLRHLALVSASVLAVGWVALVNGFPVVYFDTGTYLRTAFEGYAPDARPVFYGILIRVCAAIWNSPWSVMVAQSLLVLGCLRIAAFSFAPWRFIALLAILGVGTSLPWQTAHLIPDVFAATLLLSGVALVFDDDDGWSARRLFLAGVFLLSLLVHTSHLLIAAGGLILLGGAAVVTRQRSWLRRGALPAGLFVASLIALPLANKAMTGEAYISKGGHAFLMANLVRWGVAQRYLEAHCADGLDSPFCAYLPDLQNEEIAQDYLWHARSPLERLGGWEATSKATWDVLGPAVAQNAGLTARSAIADTWRQLVAVRTGEEAYAYSDDLVAVQKIRQWFPLEYPRFAASLQQRGKLARVAAAMKWLHYAVLVAALAWLVLGAKWDPRLVGLVSLLVVNAVVCGTLSIPDDRYQSRVAWLLVFAAMTAPARRIHQWRGIRAWRPVAGNHFGAPRPT